MAYRVTAPLVITKNTDGSDRYLYQGATLPEFVKDHEIKRLVDEGFVEQDDAAADEAKPAPAKKAPAKSGPAAESN